MSAAEILRAAQGRTVATAESCTGGMVAAALTDLPGSSAVFHWGVVTYSNQAKMDLLGVQKTTLDTHGAVSEPVAAEMAQGASDRAAVDVAVSITGIAGPGGSEFKPEGRVCFGLSTAAGVHTETVDFGAIGREAVRRAARDHALALILRALQA
ncbi:competence damage-inducible protein A [Jannaschia pagri]|uniref:Competence damage-inducible protein A n=1 Tax=Jannaschia pagri TaxID=2829797 RepID=A0ABQ4NNF4_9RHOB|nr:MULTISPECIES: CinA family protein [unclassified Jannaschia]GIT92078.1 competence damage-inducible protein A [Jannaschia sp. AI_61]GIT95913.1 competence damage-inducible protein A [Jannaschia sp. AI_62]